MPLTICDLTDKTDDTAQLPPFKTVPYSVVEVRPNSANPEK